MLLLFIIHITFLIMSKPIWNASQIHDVTHALGQAEKDNGWITSVKVGEDVGIKDVIKHNHEEYEQGSKFYHVKEYNLTLLSPEEIRRMAVMTATESQVNRRKHPKKNGVNDIRLGVVDRRLKCATCGNGPRDCPGHFGKIELPVPCIQPHFSDAVERILKCVCQYPDCHRFMRADIVDAYLEMRTVDKAFLWSHFTSGVKTNTKCPFCTRTQPLLSKTQGYFFTREWPKNNKTFNIEDLDESLKRPINIADIWHIFNSISDKDCERMGLGSMDNASTTLENGFQIMRPEHMILTVLLITPPAVRPSVVSSLMSKNREPDILTNRLQDIVDSSQKCRKKIEEIQESKTNLFGDVKSLMDEFDSEFKFKSKDVLPVITGDELHDILTIDSDIVSKLQIDINMYIMGSTGMAAAQTAASISGTSLKSNSNSKVRAPSANSGKAVGQGSLTQNMNGKQGRFRSNLVRMRTNSYARSVVIGDHMLEMDQLGVPEMIAKQMIIPETVNRFNIDRLRKAILIGPRKLNGATHVIQKNGRKRTLEFADRDERIRMAGKLRIGDEVKRILKNDDLVIFNRQPSLHKQSMMSNRVKILSGRAFRINQTTCNPYNADFDGDEMNMHAPHTLAAKAEQLCSMEVKENIISIQTNKNVMSLVMDSVTSGFLMTRDSNMIDEETVMQLSMHVKDGLERFNRLKNQKPWIYNEDKYVKDGKLTMWSGKRVFSLFLPYDFVYTYGKPSDKDKHVIIKRGLMERGVLGKFALGNTNRGIIHCLYIGWGSDRCAQFVSDSHRTLCNWITSIGFSIGIGDVILPIEDREHINGITKKLKDSVYEAEKKEIEKGVLDPNVIEAKVQGQLIKILGVSTGLAVQKSEEHALKNKFKCAFPSKNSIQLVTSCGAKGSPVNQGQMTSALGQQQTVGIRPKASLINGNRTMSYFPKSFVPSPSSRGFVSNSLIKGLSSTEFRTHMVAGIEGIVDTAVKTSDSGYEQRREVALTQNYTMDALGTCVRVSNKYCVSYRYGGDNANPERIWPMDIGWIVQGVQSLLHTHGITVNHTFHSPKALTNLSLKSDFAFSFWESVVEERTGSTEMSLKDAYDRVRHSSYLQVLGVCLQEYCDMWYGLEEDLSGKVGTKVRVPFDFDELCRRFEDVTKDDLHPEYLETMNMDEDTFILMIDEMISNVHNSKTNSHLRIIWLYRSKTFTHENKECILRRIAFSILKLIKMSRVEAGTAVGVQSAQSIGENNTQSTLNTFHHAGQANVGVLEGVPRMRELTMATDDRMKMPRTEVPIRMDERLTVSEDGSNMDMQSTLEASIFVRQVSESIIVCRDPIQSSGKTVLSRDQECMDHFHKVFGSEKLNPVYNRLSDAFKCWCFSPWIISISLDKKLCTHSKVFPREVALGICSFMKGLGQPCTVMYSEPWHSSWVVRIRIICCIDDKEGRKRFKSQRAALNKANKLEKKKNGRKGRRKGKKSVEDESKSVEVLEGGSIHDGLKESEVESKEMDSMSILSGETGLSNNTSKTDGFDDSSSSLSTSTQSSILENGDWDLNVYNPEVEKQRWYEEVHQWMSFPMGDQLFASKTTKFCVKISNKALVRGIRGVTQSVIQTKMDGTKNLVTRGSNIKIMSNMSNSVNWHFSLNNNVTYISHTLGIEAANAILFHEMRIIQGSSLDPRHISILTDGMTRNGFLLSATRNGFKNMPEMSELSKAAFEMTSQVLHNAARQGNSVDISSVAECMMAGELVPVGTNISSMITDPRDDKYWKPPSLVRDAERSVTHRSRKVDLRTSSVKLKNLEKLIGDMSWHGVYSDISESSYDFANKDVLDIGFGLPFDSKMSVNDDGSVIDGLSEGTHLKKKSVRFLDAVKNSSKKSIKKSITKRNKKNEKI